MNAIILAGMQKMQTGLSSSVPRVIGRGVELADRLLNNRKNPLKMARLLSIGFMLRLLLGILTIKKAEKEFSRILNVKARAVVLQYPEIGSDVDKAEDVYLVCAYLEKLK